MFSKLRAGLTYANVVSTLCLFIVLGGSAYAAVTITGKNVKNSSLTGTDIKNSSLTTSDVKNGSLLAGDFKSGQLPAGPQGPKGDTGAQGAQGLKGEQGLKGDKGDPCLSSDPACRGPQGPAGVPSTTVVTTTFSVPGGSFAQAIAQCVSPQPNVLGGGYEITDAVGNLANVMQTRPLLGEDGWFVRVRSGAQNPFNVTAYAVCG